MQREMREARGKARKDFFDFVRRNPDDIILVGPVSLWCRGHRSLRWIEEWLETLVVEGVLRHATEEELRHHQLVHGYFLTESGLERLGT